MQVGKPLPSDRHKTTACVVVPLALGCPEPHVLNDLGCFARRRLKPAVLKSVPWQAPDCRLIGPLPLLILRTADGQHDGPTVAPGSGESTQKSSASPGQVRRQERRRSGSVDMRCRSFEGPDHFSRDRKRHPSLGRRNIKAGSKLLRVRNGCTF